MKKFVLVLALFSLSGCASWQHMTEAEKQAWIYGTAIVIGTAVIAEGLSDSGDNICFESPHCSFD